MTDGEWIETDVPQRMDRLPWSGWHWLIVTALGITWILDGLETTLAGALGGILKDRATLHLTDLQVGASSSYYLTGAVIGALVFGYGTDRLGRKNSSTSRCSFTCAPRRPRRSRGTSPATRFSAR